MESWDDLLRRDYWEKLAEARDFWKGARKSLTLRILNTRHGTIELITHPLLLS